MVGNTYPVPSTISDVSAFNNYFLTCNSSSLSSSCCSVTVKDMCYVINPSRGMLATRRGSASSPSPWSPWEHSICQLLHLWKSWAVPKRDTLARRGCWRSPDSSRSSPSPSWGATQRFSITGCQLSKATRSMVLATITLLTRVKVLSRVMVRHHQFLIDSIAVSLFSVRPESLSNFWW